MSAKRKPEPEDFQQAAENYAKIAIENIRQMIFAMEHASECDGEMDCVHCEGTGSTIDSEGDYQDCTKCEASGKVKCTEGKDSDDPESWHDEERARERIQGDALSVEVRSDWHTPGDTDIEPSEYCILLTTGGPAARIVGDLDRGQPTRARFEYQDWLKPWTEVISDSADYAVMLQYAQQFYFGD